MRRVLLWHTAVGDLNFDAAGADQRGDGQIFWHRPAPDGSLVAFPSVRAEMLRDGIEDREYLAALRERAARLEVAVQTDEDRELLALARELGTVPDELVATQWQMTRDPDRLLARRRAIARAIERLRHRLGD